MTEQNEYGQVDLSYLRSISGNDADFMKMMLDMFLEETPKAMTELLQAIENSNFAEIKGAAHKVKPTFAMVGKDAFKDKMQDIENISKENSRLAEIKAIYTEVNSTLPSLFQDIELAKASL